jgi:UPF0176 protein
MQPWPHTILLYYKYVAIADPEAFRIQHHALCVALGLKGRIIIAKEGINGTIEGTTENITIYVDTMKADPRFADIHWKYSQGNGNAFPKLSVKVRKEIVSGHLDEQDINPQEITGTHLKPEALHQWFNEKKDFVIVDMRNDYEYEVGHFEGSVKPTMENFRDMKRFTKELAPMKEKTVLTVCTGGVRCEKASGYLKQQGFKDVYQLDGGIVSYMKQYPGQHFLGSLYVFDGRVTMHYDKPEEHVVVGKCGICAVPCERYINCKNPLCHYHFICCTQCSPNMDGALCKGCRMTPVYNNEPVSGIL